MCEHERAGMAFGACFAGFILLLSGGGFALHPLLGFSMWGMVVLCIYGAFFVGDEEGDEPLEGGE